MTHRSKRSIESRLDGLEPQKSGQKGERPPDLTDEEKRVLDEYFSPPYDGDKELEDLIE